MELFFDPERTRLMFTCVLGRHVAFTVLSVPKLQALVYDILPSTTAVLSYAIGSKNCQLTSSFLLVLKQK